MAGSNVSPDDLDAVAAWFYCNSGSINFAPWNKAAEHCKKRWRVVAKRLFTKPPPQLVRYIKESS